VASEEAINLAHRIILKLAISENEEEVTIENIFITEAVSAWLWLMLKASFLKLSCGLCQKNSYSQKL